MRSFISLLMAWSLLISFATKNFHIKAQNIRGSIPDVHFALFRLDYNTYRIKGYIEFDQSMKKVLPKENYLRSGDWYYQYVSPCDFGIFELKSLLTGQRLAHAQLVWQGRGHYDFPPDSLFRTDIGTGTLVNAPDTVIKIFFNHPANNAGADSAWHVVQSTNVLQRISALGRYEVAIFRLHDLNEWLVAVNTRPRAPINLGFLPNVWPDSLITRNVYFSPQVVIHNFSDDTLRNLNAFVYLERNGQWLYSSYRDIPPLPPDVSQTVTFDSLKTGDTEPLHFHYKFMHTILGEDWSDSYPEDDTMHVVVQPVNQPVFRPVSSIKHPGAVPLFGTPGDVDGDGDPDIVQATFSNGIRIWLNDRGTFRLHPDTAQFANVPFPRKILIKDFNGDGHADLLFISFKKPLMLFAGNGQGEFTDMSAQSGLTNYLGYWEAEALDLENDGDPDLIVQTYKQDVVLQNDGQAHFTEITKETGLKNPVQTEDIEVGDLDNDGYSDVLFVNWGERSKIYHNNGDGTFSSINHGFDYIYSNYGLIFDANRDGLNDILLCMLLDERPSFLSFQKPTMKFFDGISLPSAFAASAADVNGDRWPDVILDNGRMGISLLLNREGTFSDRSDLLIHVNDELTFNYGSTPHATFLDLDGDGDLDIYSRYVVLENQGFDSTLTGLKQTFPPLMPQRLKLEQNYPNPFNASTKIRFYLPRADFVRISVYDIRGQKIKDLFKGRKTAGKHEIIWDGLNEAGQSVSSGCYFYRLKMGRAVQTRKMLLIR